MRPRAHVIRDVVCHDALQSCGAHDDHVIEALASNRSDEPLNVGILPGRDRDGRQLFMTTIMYNIEVSKRS
jgi:hypothetical protein